jgi:protoheme IX farnesyltransferase
VYSLSLVPVGLLPYLFHISGSISAIVVSFAGVIFTYYAVRLYNTCSDKAALQVMFSSIIYLPVVMIALVLDKI